MSSFFTAVHDLHGGFKKEDGSWLGYDLSYIKNELVEEQRISGLMYADDIVLMADDRIGMQGLMDIWVGSDAP